MRETKRKGTAVARKLRRTPTEAEIRFWAKVRRRQLNGAKFRRQWPIESYVVDFVCLEARLVVELDGGQHADNADDIIRTAKIVAAGYRVIRFWNNDVLSNTNGILETVSQALAEAPPHPRD
jgi:very-short-patch-repair endonuclease